MMDFMLQMMNFALKLMDFGVFFPTQETAKSINAGEGLSKEATCVFI